MFEWVAPKEATIMPTTECSHCGEEVDALPLNESDTMFDWQCPSCRQGVLIDGKATELKRQRQAREDIIEQIQDLATELDTHSYEPAPYSVAELKDRLNDIIDDIDAELNQRESN